MIIRTNITVKLTATNVSFDVSAPTSSPAAVNEDDILGLIIITVVCCAVGTSIVWVVIIYQTRRRLNTVAQGGNVQPPTTVVTTAVPDTQTHLYLETSSQHSKDSGMGDSTNPSSDQLQLCLPGMYEYVGNFIPV